VAVGSDVSDAADLEAAIENMCNENYENATFIFYEIDYDNGESYTDYMIDLLQEQYGSQGTAWEYDRECVDRSTLVTVSSVVAGIEDRTNAYFSSFFL
jgi:hypothetical protein